MNILKIMTFAITLISIYKFSLSKFSSFIINDKNELKSRKLELSQKYLNQSSHFLAFIGFSFSLIIMTASDDFINYKVQNYSPILGVISIILVSILFSIVLYSTYRADKSIVSSLLEDLSNEKMTDLNDHRWIMITQILQQRKKKIAYSDVEEIKKTAIKYFEIN